MKTFFKAAAAVLLAATLFIQAPARAYAQEVNKPDYISEVKIAMGSGAEDALEGYTILKDEKGKVVDLNQDAGGGWGSQGDRRVILGYKTTKEQSEAITDLAVMNMKGGYDVQEYEALIQQRMDAQVIPMIRRFLATINEYRENMVSDDDVNRERAQYMHDALNKFTDDDCGGAGLGDLLLNPTKFEMGDAAYNALTEDQKKQHCDIVTMFMQADGQLMLMIYDLLTRAADTNEDSWLERFSAITYDDLLSSYDMPETDAKIQAAKDFEDDARILLQNWDQFREVLTNAEEKAAGLESMEGPDEEALADKVNKLGDQTSSDEIADAGYDMILAQAEQSMMVILATNAAVAAYLRSFDHEDGTLFDFFTRSSADIENDITVLYPLIASLSEGQRAGLEYISLRELVIAGSRENDYSDLDLETLETTSVYEGVDRAIYEKGGVALTWAARREEAMAAEQNAADKNPLSTKTIVMWALTGAAGLGFIASASAWAKNGIPLLANKIKLASYNRQYKNLLKLEPRLQDKVFVDPEAYRRLKNLPEEKEVALIKIETQGTYIKTLPAASKTAAWMSAGFAAAMVVLAGVSLYLTWEDMKNYYKVDFSPIPHCMVDETAITYYNANGQKLVKENHAAYYKAVTVANRTDDKYIKILGDCADLNGDVGQQWLALYACWDNKACQPILADSLKAVVGSQEVPAGYETGIHMFGSESAFNLNNKMYDWNQSAKSIFVYFQIDKDAKIGDTSTSGSAFSGGWIALAAVLGMGLGAAVTAVSMKTIRRKKERIAEA